MAALDGNGDGRVNTTDSKGRLVTLPMVSAIAKLTGEQSPDIGDIRKWARTYDTNPRDDKLDQAEHARLANDLISEVEGAERQ